MSTPHAIPILICREPAGGARRAIEAATGTLVPGPGLDMHVWSPIDDGQRDLVGTRTAVARPPRWPRSATRVA